MEQLIKEKEQLEKQLKEQEKSSKKNSKSKSSSPFPSLIKNKKKVEDTHSRVTFLIENELAETLHELLTEVGHGAKKAFINDVIRRALPDLEKEVEKLRKERASQ